MENSLILCGGTGAHVGVAFLRLHTLGYALGYFKKGGASLNFPKMFLVDQDSGDAAEGEYTAWQLAASLVSRHPGRFNWQTATGRNEGPELVKVTPLPIGQNQQWYKPPYSSLASRFEASPLLGVLTSERQRSIDYSKGMMGSPAVGSLLFRLKEYDERDRELNYDETFGQMLKTEGTILVAGSGVGGTGASVGPTIARRMADRAGNQVMAVMVLNWFDFEEDEGDDDKREKAQLRNRMMKENANSALEYYGQSLAQTVAAVPVGMPERAYIKRRFTSDVGQPIRESFVHAVGALSGYRHYLRERPYGSGLYIMGAVERGRLDGATAIPGGTLQDLANRAATLHDLLEAWRKVLSRDHHGRVTPAIYSAVESTCDPRLVADHLTGEISHYRAQLDWLKSALQLEGVPNHELSRETESRGRLVDDRRGLPISADTSPEQVATALFQWTAEWIAEVASANNGLVFQPGDVHGGHWPDLRNEAINVAARANGDLTRIPDQDIAAVLEAFVDAKHLAANGWPHPLAAADYFRHAIERRNAIAFRQLELLLVGLVSGRFELKPLASPSSADAVSLEKLASEYRRQGFEGLAEHGIFDRERGGALIGFNSPHTLLCPVAFMNDAADNRLWQELWVNLCGFDDGAPWTEAPSPASWGRNDLVVKQIRAWIEHEKRSHAGGSPPWTKAFEWYLGGAGFVPFGTGAFTKVYWGSSNAPSRPLVNISLPARDTGNRWIPAEGTPMLSEPELRSLVSDLYSVSQDGRVLYEMVEFEIPDRQGKVRGWWEEHLDQLRQAGQVHIWSRSEGNALILGLMKDGALHASVLEDSAVLDRATIAVASCVPLVQKPQPGAAGSLADVRYPDIPLKSDYLDLVQTPDSRHLLDLAKRAETFESAQWRPTPSRDSQGRHVVKWSVRLRGRSTPLPVEIRLENEPNERAHWVVWPSFRSKPQPANGSGWRAYYFYEDCTDPRMVCDLLWLSQRAEPQGDRLHKRLNSGEGGPFPLAFDSSSGLPTHSGGPPIALTLRNKFSGEEAGLYLVHLQALGETAVDLKIGIDFGTSHSVAAFAVAGEPPRQVGFRSELDASAARRDGRLYLHISENWEHVTADEDGLVATGVYLPTYRLTKSNGLMPSELLLTRPLGVAQADSLAGWAPVRDFTIPPLDIGRSNLPDYVLTDFKWDAGSEYFRGRETELREHYLGLFLDLALAEIIVSHVRGLPSRRVNLTFTYPLRGTETQLHSLFDSFRRVAQRGELSYGIPIGLTNDVGLFDESRAARVTAESVGEVSLVADLGGGTLDLFIASKAPDRTPVGEVADSVKLGGNLLLRQIAEQPDGYLPRDSGWGFGDVRETETKLRAWMRSGGSAQLFGVRAEGRPAGRLSAFGFEKASEANNARLLLDRYFNLIIEYMARNLVAYLVGEWFPKVDADVQKRLKISVQLRGNGWRLRYQRETYDQATQTVQDLVRRRVTNLWPLAPGNEYACPEGDERWESPSRYAVVDPKAAPIQSVVGKAMAYERVTQGWYTHALVDLEVFRGNGNGEQVSWCTKIPFKTGGSSQVQVDGLQPPILLSSPGEDRQVEVSELDAGAEGSVNWELQNNAVREGELYRAPVAPLVWEAVFASKAHWKRE